MRAWGTISVRKMNYGAREMHTDLKQAQSIWLVWFAALNNKLVLTSNILDAFTYWDCVFWDT